MKCLFPLAALSVITLSFAIPSVAADKDDVLAAVESYRTGMLKRDAATLDKVLHKDLAYTHSNGKLEDKAECIKNATTGSNVTSIMDLSKNTVRVYGNMAIVRGDAHTKSSTGDLNLAVLYIWLKTPQGWQLTARQATRYLPQ